MRPSQSTRRSAAPPLLFSAGDNQEPGGGEEADCEERAVIGVVAICAVG